MNYWVQLIYILAVADVMGFIMLAILFVRMRNDFGWLLAFLFMSSAIINATGTMAIAATMPDHFTNFTLSYGLSRAVRICAQLMLIMRVLGFFPHDPPDNTND